MSLRKKVLKNTTYLAAGDKIGYVLQFLFFLYFAKKYGVIPVGEYSFAFFYTYIFALFSDLGVTVYLLREVARRPSDARELFFDCLVLRIASLVVMTLAAIVVTAVFFNDFSENKLAVVVSWGLYWIFYYIADVFLAELNGHEKMGRVALLSIWLKLLSTVAGVLMIYMKLDYTIVLIAFPAGSFIYMCSSVLVSRYSLGPLHIKFKKLSHYKSFFVELMPFFFSIILLEILVSEDVILLGIIQDDQSVGLYSSAIKLVTFIFGISTFINVAIFPVLSKLFMESKERLIEVSKQMVRYLIIASLPVTVGLMMTADKIIEFLYSESFADAAIVLKIASWTIAAGIIPVVYSVLLTVIDRQKEKVVYIGINFFITTILNVVLIYYFSYIGAAISKVISTLIGMIFFVYLVSKYFTFLPLLKYIFKPAIACAVMVLFISFFHGWNLFVLIALSGLIYFITLFILGDFTEKEIGYLRKLLPGTLNSG